MKRFSLLLLCCLPAWEASAQGTGTLAPVFDDRAMEIIQALTVLSVLGYFLLAVIKLVLNHLLKNKVVDAAAVPENVVERLFPGPQDEQNKAVKWFALLLSTGAGLALCNQYLPWGIHSVVILLFSTALGFLAYFLFLRRQPK